MKLKFPREDCTEIHYNTTFKNQRKIVYFESSKRRYCITNKKPSTAPLVGFSVQTLQDRRECCDISKVLTKNTLPGKEHRNCVKKERN
jgi:hypothetical protein